MLQIESKKGIKRFRKLSAVASYDRYSEFRHNQIARTPLKVAVDAVFAKRAAHVASIVPTASFRRAIYLNMLVF